MIFNAISITIQSNWGLDYLSCLLKVVYLLKGIDSIWALSNYKTYGFNTLSYCLLEYRVLNSNSPHTFRSWMLVSHLMALFLVCGGCEEKVVRGWLKWVPRGRHLEVIAWSLTLPFFTSWSVLSWEDFVVNSTMPFLSCEVRLWAKTYYFFLKLFNRIRYRT